MSLTEFLRKSDLIRNVRGVCLCVGITAAIAYTIYAESSIVEFGHPIDISLDHTYETYLEKQEIQWQKDLDRMMNPNQTQEEKRKADKEIESGKKRRAKYKVEITYEEPEDLEKLVRLSEMIE